MSNIKNFKNSSEPDVDDDTKYRVYSDIFKLLEKDGMEIKDCAYGQSRTEFIKGKTLEEFIFKETNLKQISKILNDKLHKTISTEPNAKNETMQSIYKDLISIKMVKKACREENDKRKNVKRLLEYEDIVIRNGCNCGKDHDVEDLDHPKKLDLNKLYSFENNFYYVLRIQRSKSWNYVFLFLIIFGILMYALMPIWPYKVKVTVWWVSYVLLLFMCGIYLFRFVVFIFFYIFGYSIWVFPDINDDKLGFIDSFRRLVSVDKTNIEWYKIVFRLIIAITFSYVAFTIYKRPAVINDSWKVIVDAIKDMYLFGEDKVVNSWNSTAVQLKSKIKSIEELDKL